MHHVASWGFTVGLLWLPHKHSVSRTVLLLRSHLRNPAHFTDVNTETVTTPWCSWRQERTSKCSGRDEDDSKGSTQRQWRTTTDSDVHRDDDEWLQRVHVRTVMDSQVSMETMTDIKVHVETIETIMDSAPLESIPNSWHLVTIVDFNVWYQIQFKLCERTLILKLRTSKQQCECFFILFVAVNAGTDPTPWIGPDPSNQLRIVTVFQSTDAAMEAVYTWAVKTFRV